MCHNPTMRPCRAACALALAAVVLAVATLPLTAAVRPPRLNYELATLPNGLTVVLLEDHSTPIVHVQLWYHVGSKDERPGRTGFAHLFEHLMFNGSKNVPAGDHSALIVGVGGMANAYTNDDVTVYWSTVPSQHLPLALWLEADRMASLTIDKASFERERKVVKEERRLRIDNHPYGTLAELIYRHTFTVHPYRHTTIGSMADLDAASVENVRDFYRSYYVPANATVAIVGDFEPKQAMALVSQHLGAVPRADRAVPRDLPREPEQREERRVSLAENWPLPVVVVAYHVPFDGHPDAYPLQVASKVLSDGQSSRIYRSLVYEKQIALAAYGGGNIIEDPNLFFAVAVVQAGHSTDEAERALLEELDRLKSEPVAERELQRVKNQLARDYILGRESNQRKAAQLAHAVMIHRGDASTADAEFDTFMATTADDVQRVARAYFRPENRTILTILPAQAKQ
jgi:zinc protease